MQTTQHTPSKCQVHLHPSANNPFLVFEVRRLARNAGCQYVTREQSRAARTASNGPFGGDAA
jgi:hypothetical protein